MKLATLKDGTRDGKLVVVNRDLTRAVVVAEIAATLQSALDRWDTCQPKLEACYTALNQDPNLVNSIVFETRSLESPLPRAYQWADASAYVNHVELVRKARGAKMPDNFWTDPLMYQGGSDAFLGPCDDIVVGSEEWGIDFEGEIAVITGDVPYGASPTFAGQAIRLLMLVNDVSLRNLIPNEMAKGFGFFQSKPASAFSPVAITPDELGSAWRDFKVHLSLVSYLNGQLFGQPNAGVDMTFDFSTLIAHAAKTRELRAGSIIGSGTVSNVDRRRGGCCIAEKRMLETIETGQPQTSFMCYGDVVRIEMLNEAGQNLFGSIEQTIIPVQ